MNNTKTTKRALLSSVMAMLICVAMLIGTTFAWFTDSASTAVNKIQAGTLDVALEMKDASGNWVNAEGETLGWVAEDGREQNEIFWEPGCTYKLPTLKITNKGNLALQFKVLVNGISGDMDLLNALEFTCNYAMSSEEYFDEDEAVTIQGSDIVNHLPYELPREYTYMENEYPGLYDDLEAEYGVKGTQLIPIEAGELYEGCDVGYYSIKAHMKEEAGNEYQGKQLNGIAITLVATQLATYEYDSFDFIYDKDAQYPDIMFVGGDNAAEVKEELKDALTADKEEIIVSLTSDVTYDVAAWSENAMGGDSTKTITINGNGHKILFNNTNSDWNNIVTGDAKLVINNAIVDNSGYNADGGTWNGHDITFLNDVEFNKVTFTNAVAVTANAVFNNCSISDVNSTSDAYMLWIRAGANVKIDGLNINGKNANTGINNRAIKIADQYIDDPAMTYLSVKNATISSDKKAAILVTSTAGANIELENVNISNVAADSTNAVWKDNGSDAWKNAPVTVNGGTCIVEP